MGRRWKQTKL